VTTKFSVGDRVIVSPHFWAKDATGTIPNRPPEVTALSGLWHGGLTRQEVSSLGTNRFIGYGSTNPNLTPTGTVHIGAGKFGEPHLLSSQKVQIDPSPDEEPPLALAQRRVLGFLIPGAASDSVRRAVCLSVP